MDITSDVFWLPKEGHTREEYEDAYAVSEGEGWPLRAAVADGATESTYAGLWARILADSFVQASDLPGELATCRTRWRERVNAEVNDSSWYGRQKVEEGAFATFLGLEVTRDGNWAASAVGDCCLLIMRDDELQLSWPYAEADVFGNRPALVSSRDSAEQPAVLSTAGSVAPGDTVLLTTDAVAEWLLKHEANDRPRWEEQWQEARAEGSIRNDDCTLIQLTVHE